MRNFLLLIPTVFCLMLASCSIKEDRSGCPCRLEVTVAGGDDGRCRLSVSGEDFFIRDSIDIKERWHGFVPKGEYEVYAASGIHNAVSEGGVVICPDGSEMDEMFSGRASVSAVGESLGIALKLHRQSAFIHISVFDPSMSEYPYFLRLKGNFCGFDIVSSRPVKGDYSVLLYPVMGLYHRVCVPRQGDDSLELEFYERAGGRYAGSIPVGIYIKSSGYDWHSEDLKDIRMDIDYVDTGVKITISGWDSVMLPEYSCLGP